MTNSGREDSAAVLVGRLIRSYRADARRNGKRLSQDGLLDLMVENGEEYATDLDRSSISHWERGTRVAPRAFIVAFGRTLNVPKGEMDSLLDLAGYDSLGEEEGRAAILAAALSIETQVETLQREVRDLIDSASPPSPSVDANAVVKNALLRMAPPGVYALVVGFVLNAMGQNGTLALLAYVLMALAIVIGQGVLRWLKADRDGTRHDHIVDLFFISIFFTLNGSLLIGTLTKADHFGFYTIDSFTNTPMPFLLTTLAHLALSLIASIMFSVFWRRQQGPTNTQSAFTRAVWITLPPTLFVYVNIIVFTNLGAWISFMIVLVILFGAFTTIVALNEPGTSLEEADFVFKAVVIAITLLCSFGIVGTILAYLDTDMVLTAADVRIIPLQEISAERLGYTPEEGVKLLRLGALWMSLANIAFMVTAVGGYLIVTIRRVARQG